MEVHDISCGIRQFVRTNLQEAVARVSEKPLLMIIAPSGYGKSTFVRQYFSQKKDLKNIWFAFQRGETDENWIWQRICKRTGESNPDLAEHMAKLEMPKTSQELAYIIRLIRKYVTQPTYLMLDDYHNCECSDMNRLIEEIVCADTMMHIILISRTFPEISYEEMFLKGQCVLLDREKLALTKEETEEILLLNRIRASREELDRLYEYTTGWISAVYLALFEYKKNGGFGCFYGVNHLLKTAIFDKLTPKMQEFYSKLSLFDWFYMDGARYITEMDVTQREVFENKEQFGFLYYDERNESFAMHALLRNVAEEELKKSDIDVKRLYDRAGQWREKKQDYVMAVRYYGMAGNWERIAQLYAGEHGKEMLEQAPKVYEKLKESIQEPVWEKYISVMLKDLYFHALRESAEEFWPKYREAEQKLVQSEKWSRNPRVAGEMQVILSGMQFNDLGKMTDALREACRLLQGQTSILLEGSLLTYGTTCMTVLYCRESGTLRETIQQEKEYAAFYMQLTRGAQTGWDTFFDAEYAMLTGDLVTAGELAGRVCQQALFRGQDCIAISSYYMMLRSMIYQGEREQFFRTIQEMDEKLDAQTTPVLHADMDLIEGYMYACIGEIEKIPDWLRNFKMENCSRYIRSSRAGCMTYGKMLIAEKNWEMLEMIGDQMLEPYEKMQNIQSRVAGLLYKAIARDRQGRREDAVELLKQAVGLAEPDDFRIPFIENEKELEPILKECKESSFLKLMQEQMAQYRKGVNCFHKEPEEQQNLLTGREQELMEYVKNGYRNAQIAEAMHIAQVTVEKNLTSIYRKLEVKNRTAAIRKWTELQKN